MGMMILEKEFGVEELLKLVNSRALQIIFICLSTLLLCQIFKFIFFSIKEKKLNYKYLFTTGGFPSSHSALCITLVTSLFLFQMHDLHGKIDWSFAVSVIFSVIIIHDAMGVRLEASKHAKILNHMTSDLPIEEKEELGFGKKGALKEMLGHKGLEVFGGILFGFLVGISGYFIFVNLI